MTTCLAACHVCREGCILSAGHVGKHDHGCPHLWSGTFSTGTGEPVMTWPGPNADPERARRIQVKLDIAQRNVQDAINRAAQAAAEAARIDERQRIIRLIERGIDVTPGAVFSCAGCPICPDIWESEGICEHWQYGQWLADAIRNGAHNAEEGK